MANYSERQKDILKLIEKLDITPTMYKNADEKYHAIANYLSEYGIEADFYPQGSFAFGTVVRPSVKDPDAAYDLDFICQVQGTKKDIAPSELRRRIQEALESSNRYGGKLEVYKECFTVEYADVSGTGFKIDIIPAVDDDLRHKLDLQQKSQNPELMDTLIVIPKENGERNYSWISNNPKGFKAWFDGINKPFLESEKNRRAAIQSMNQYTHYASVDDIPDYMERTSIQRVIQILKYHRDNYYDKLSNGDDLKPISAIINMIVASISKNASPLLDSFELLNYVLEELKAYSEYMFLSPHDFRKKYANRQVIKKDDNSKWIVQNPADPEDNLADQWNENPMIPVVFFRWINACNNDLFAEITKPDCEFRNAMENAFGESIIQRMWGEKYKNISRPAPRPIVSSNKPYHRKA